MNRLNLNELDQQLINCTMGSKSNSSISYGQLYDIARSIIAIDFDQTINSNNKSSNDGKNSDHDELEKTLTKILQLCQTIINFLLADIRRLEVDRTELTNRNNLIQENRKLRKLLQLQQKSIIYRRMNFLSITNSPDHESIIDQNGNNGNNDDNSLYSLDQLPTDSKSSCLNSSKIQCSYCSKIFSDSQAFTKHLQLRHFSSNIDDPSQSLQSSVASNLSFVQRILQQHCCLKQQQQELLQSSDISVSDSKIEELCSEIDILKDKLSKTETQLNEEKSARRTLENDLKNNFQEQIQSIKTKLENKIKKIQLHQRQHTKIDHNNYQEELMDKNHNEKNQQQKSNDKKLKQNLRMELISQLTTKREQRQKQIPVSTEINHTKKLQQTNKGENNDSEFSTKKLETKSLKQPTDKAQSRHDYDFVQIETSIRDMIDMKLKNEIQENDSLPNSDQTKEEEKAQSLENKIEIIEIGTKMKKSPEPEKKKDDTNSTKELLNGTNNLKSILKDPTKMGNNKRNITFNNEVIEFEISPLASDNDDDDDDWTPTDDHLPMESVESEIEIINTNEDNRVQSMNNSKRMFIIGDDLNLTFRGDQKSSTTFEEISSISSSTTSSTTSSEDENEQVIRKTPINEPINNYNQQNIQQVIKVDVHGKSLLVNSNENSPIPVPAKRKNVPQPVTTNTFNHALNSLLDNDNEKIDKSNNEQTRRVSELAELIEKKLQSPARSSLSQNSTKKLPPLGSLSNLKKSSTSSSDNQSIIAPTGNVTSTKSDSSFLNNTNLNSRNNILDAYDLYEF
ncbi:uncharacterized protein LOC124497116 [Dermatophagoides farinae]|uniref:uncharacterized protein LOC124497116 n=1 Tax=Dermatophagoides farinae TaxID=6954 RepID=UPI003F644C63